MTYQRICAFCRHWEIGTLDIETRISEIMSGKTYPCHRHQPAEFRGDECCNYFDEVQK